MTKEEFKQAFARAMSDEDLTNEDFSTLYGCALPDFPAPVHTTIGAVARLIRWDAGRVNPDMKEVDRIAHIARRKFIIIG